MNANDVNAIECTCLSDRELSEVVGGLKWEGQRESTNIVNLTGSNILTTGDFARWDRRLDQGYSAQALCYINGGSCDWPY